MTSRYTVSFRKSDEFAVVPGSGWVVLENGKRIDWPMLATREEAEADRADFIREMRALASDEASERFGMMSGVSNPDRANSI